MVKSTIWYSAFASYGATGLLSARIGSFAPSVDVYGSYFPAWLICLIAGVILTILASQLGRLFDLSALRKFGPLIPLSLILIFSITTWFLFFAS
jgi:YtcA family